MDARDYERLASPFGTEGRKRAFRLTDRVLTAYFVVTYLGTCIVLASTAHPALPRFIAVPALTFVGLSALRHVIDAPRPYERLAIEPVLGKRSPGKSFPGRHAFSATIIAMAMLYLHPVIGMVDIVLAALLSAIRVVGGVHYPHDVVAGMLFSIAIGVLGFWVV